MINKNTYEKFRLLNAIVLFLMIIIVISYFCVPVFYVEEIIEEIEFLFKLKLKFVDFLNIDKASFNISGVLILIGYAITILNAIMNLGQNNKYTQKTGFMVFNFMAVISCLTSLICGLYLIFSIKYTHIALITIFMLSISMIIQTFVFFKCNELKVCLEENKKEIQYIQENTIEDEFLDVEEDEQEYEEKNDKKFNKQYIAIAILATLLLITILGIFKFII